jgi:hypothetical protein
MVRYDIRHDPVAGYFNKGPLLRRAAIRIGSFLVSKAGGLACRHFGGAAAATHACATVRARRLRCGKVAGERQDLTGNKNKRGE